MARHYTTEGMFPLIEANWQDARQQLLEFQQLVEDNIVGLTGGGVVTTVFGRTGAVVAETGDYTWSQIGGTTLPAVSGVNLTNLNAGALSVGTIPDARFPATLPALNGSLLTNLNASALASGTIPDARFPAVLPAVSGQNLTNLNASNLASGTVPAARMPAFSGEVASAAGTTTLTIGGFASSFWATKVTDETGTGLWVFNTSPSLVTPSLGVATATSINKVQITAPASGATLTIANGKVLAVNSTISLGGVDGKSLTLTNSMQFLSLGADPAVMTFPSSGNVALGAGSSSVSSANVWNTADHTHAVASSSNPGAAASILATNASGHLRLVRIGAGVDPARVADFLDTTGPQLRLSYSGVVYNELQTNSSGNLTLSTSGGAFFAIGPSLRLQSSNYVSQTTGWSISYAGGVDVRYMYVDELHARSFIADLEQALAGGQIISKSVAELATAFELPDPGGGATFTVRDLPSAPGMAVYQSGDMVRFRQFSRASGSLSIADAWGTVSSFVNNGNGTQTWLFVRSSGAQGGTAGVSSTEFLTSVVHGATIYNAFTGYIGFRFTTPASSPPTVTALGRMRFTGNSQTHNVRIFNAAGTVIASVSIDMSSGTVDQFKYVNLASPVALSASTTYYVMSEEFPSGDNFYLNDSSSATLNAACGNTLVANYAFPAPGSWNDNGSGQLYVPVNLKFSTGAGGSPFINAGTLVLDYGTTGNGFYEVNSIDGPNAVNSPYAQIVTWSGHPQNGQVVRTRMGNLNGITGVIEYGLFAGNGGIAATNKYVRITDQNFEIHNIGLDLYEGSTKTISLNQSTPYVALGNPMPTSYLQASTSGIWMGHAGSSQYRMRVGTVNSGGALTAGWTWDSTTLTIIGTVSATAGLIGGWTIAASEIYSSGLHLFASGTALSNRIYMGAGSYNDAATPVYMDGVGRFSLGNKLTFDGANLTLPAGSITSRELNVGNFYNMAENPGFEQGNIGWVLGAGMTIVNAPATARSGGWYLNCLTTGQDAVNARYVECKPGDKFYAECYVTSTGAGSAAVILKWYDTNKALLSTVSGNYAFGSYVLSTIQSPAPANAVYVRCGVNTSGGVGWRVDDFLFVRGELSGWTIDSTTISAPSVVMKSGAFAYLAFGSTPPTSLSTGTGIFINSTGFYGLNVNKATVSASATTGNFACGSDLSSPSTTSFAAFGTAMTYNSESLAAGDIIMGDNSVGKANVKWDRAGGILRFRGGTTTNCYVDTTGAIVTGNSFVVMDTAGMSFRCATGNGVNRRIQFKSDAAGAVAGDYAYIWGYRGLLDEAHVLGLSVQNGISTHDSYLWMECLAASGKNAYNTMVTLNSGNQYTSAFQLANQDMYFWTGTKNTLTAANAQMVLQSNGGLKLGNTSGGFPGPGSLNVAGDVYRNGTAYTNPDYVLEWWATGEIVLHADKAGAMGYKGPLSLGGLREYVKTRYHLPRFGKGAGHGVFSGGDAVLASLEEAYIYIFQLEDRIKQLEEANKR